MKLDWLKSVDAALWPLGAAVGVAGSDFFVFRRTDPRILLLRPGGMGDLILLDIAAEELGLSPDRFLWLIEKRAEAWAKLRKLPYLCIDDGLARRHLEIAGRFPVVVNTEQRFGLSHASSRLAKRWGGKL